MNTPCTRRFHTREPWVPATHEALSPTAAKRRVRFADLPVAKRRQHLAGGLARRQRANVPLGLLGPMDF